MNTNQEPRMIRVFRVDSRPVFLGPVANCWLSGYPFLICAHQRKSSANIGAKRAKRQNLSLTGAPRDWWHRAACVRSRKMSPRQQNCRAVWSEAQRSDIKNEKAVRQLDGLLFQGRIVPTEFEKAIRTFWRNLIGQRKAVSRNFSRINVFVFNNLISLSTLTRK
jgi:hypothetical protein